MTTPISTDDALQMLAELFEQPRAGLRPDTPRDSVPGWDSMGALSLMAELDERFGIELGADASREMTRIGDVLSLLRGHGALSGA